MFKNFILRISIKIKYQNKLCFFQVFSLILIILLCVQSVFLTPFCLHKPFHSTTPMRIYYILLMVKIILRPRIYNIMVNFRKSVDKMTLSKQPKLYRRLLLVLINSINTYFDNAQYTIIKRNKDKITINVQLMSCFSLHVSSNLVFT